MTSISEVAALMLNPGSPSIVNGAVTETGSSYPWAIQAFMSPVAFSLPSKSIIAQLPGAASRPPSKAITAQVQGAAARPAFAWFTGTTKRGAGFDRGVSAKASQIANGR